MNTATQTVGFDSQVDDSLQLVTFEVAREEFAVDILAVHEINRMMELTRVPQAPSEIEGVINLRGKIIPVMDLRTRFGIEARERDDQTRIIVVEVESRVIGFIVDRVRQVLPISRSIVEPAPDMVATIDSQFIAGVGKLPDRLLILLDLEHLLGGELAEVIDSVTESMQA